MVSWILTVLTLSSVSSPASEMPADYRSCVQYLEAREEGARRANVLAYLAGAPILESAVSERYQTLDPDTINALEIPLLQRELGKYLYASSSHKLLGWRLSHPSLDPNWIEGVQQAVRELADRPELLAQVQSQLKKIQDFEKHRTWWHNLIRATYRIFGSEYQKPDREYKAAIEKYNEPDSLMAKINRFCSGPLTPILYGGIKYGQSCGKIPAGLEAGVMVFLYPGALKFARTLRVHLIQLKTFLDASAELSRILGSADSTHLKFLGSLLGATTQGNHPLKIKPSASAIRNTSTTQAGSLIGTTTLISNFTLYLADRGARNNLDRIVGISGLVSELDLLHAYASYYNKARNDLSFPKIKRDSGPEITLTDASHPTLYFMGTNPVPNSVELSQQGTSTQFVTGLNARGKSTFLRTVGLSAIMAQNGMPVPARSMTIKPNLLVTLIKKGDSTEDSESTFRAEAKRVGKLLSSVEGKQFLLLSDELFSGTSSEEKVAAEEAFYRYVSTRGGLTIAASHTRELTALEGMVPGFINFHVSDTDDQMYRVLPGPSRRRNAFKVLAEEGVPQELTDLAYQIYRGPTELDEFDKEKK